MTARRPARAKPTSRSKARPVKKAVKKTAKKAVRKTKRPAKKSKPKGPRITTKAKSRSAFQPMEQVTVSCVNCGREFTIVKIPGLSTEGMICSRCSFGEMQLPSD